MHSSLKIAAAFPTVFKRAYPALNPRTQMIAAVSLLGFHEIDVLPLESESGVIRRGILGFSTLSRLMALGLETFASFLEKPCGGVAEELPAVGVDDPLEELLDTFMRRMFGFAVVHGGDGTSGLLGLTDVLSLYERGMIGTDLVAEDVATPMFSMPADTTLRQAVRAMFEHRHRRIFVYDSGGAAAFISDRDVIRHMFNPAALSGMAGGSGDVLDLPIGEMESRKPKKVASGTPLKALALALVSDRGQSFLSDGGVITPWDIVMKPWAKNALRIGEGMAQTARKRR